MDTESNLNVTTPQVMFGSYYFFDQLSATETQEVRNALFALPRRDFIPLFLGMPEIFLMPFTQQHLENF